MAQTRTDFIAGKMNKSVDERLVPPGQYIDALNVRLGSTEGTEIGAVENSKGNSKLTQLEYAGEPLTGEVRTIGCFEDGINETIYWFVHNEGNTISLTGVVDMIVSFNTNTNTLTYHVVTVSLLNFSFSNLITGVSKIEDLLFFTDDLNPPRLINVKRNYAQPISINDQIEEEDIGVIVKPPGFEDYDTVAPLGTPHIEFLSIPGEENYMDTRFLSFAYRYRYEDGEYSATSLFSTPAFQPLSFQLSLQNYWNEGMQNLYNACNITFSTGSSRVKEIDLLYKQSTSNVIYVIKRYVKDQYGWGDNNFQTTQFSNSEIYTTLGSDELLRLYDNVPRLAKAQTIQGNRLMYGNYVDGYDITSTEGGTDIFIDYRLKGISREIGGVDLGNLSPQNPTISTGTYNIDPVNLNKSVNGSVLNWDLSGLIPTGSTNITPGTTINFNFQIEQIISPDCTSPGTNSQCSNTSLQSPSPFDISISFTCQQPYNTVDELLSDSSFINRFGQSLVQNGAPNSAPQGLYPCDNSGAGGTLSDKFYLAAESPMAGSELRLVYGSVNNECSTASMDTNPFPTVCGTTVLNFGTTDGASTGELTNTSFDFSTLTGISVGDIVTDTTTGDQATIIAIPGAGGNNTIAITDLNGGITTLQESGTSYEITPANATTPFCLPDGFEYNHTPGASTFTLQVPATQYFFADGTASNETATAFRYYNFIAFNCTAFFTLQPYSGSLHSNRDYEVGVVYMDEYGRASTVLTSANNTLFFGAATSVNRNQIQVTLSNIPPYWAKKYKFVVKPSQGTYETIYCNTFFRPNGSATETSGLPILTNDPSQVWFKLEGQNSNILQIGDELTVKQDSDGPALNQPTSVVLDIQAFSGKGITDKSLAGLYMKLRPDGWVANVPDDAYYFYGTNSEIRYIEDGNALVTWLGQYAGYSYGISMTNLNSIFGNNTTVYGGLNSYPLNDINNVPYTIPAGSSITIKISVWRGGNKCRRRLTYSRTFGSSADYANFHAWAIGDDLESKIYTPYDNEDTIGVSENDGLALVFNPDLITTQIPTTADLQALTIAPSPWSSSTLNIPPTPSLQVSLQISTNSTGGLFMALGAGIGDCVEFNFGDTGKFTPHASLTIEVRRVTGAFVFETKPQEADPNLFYDASDLLEIEPELPGTQAFHKAKRNFNPLDEVYNLPDGDQDQSSTAALVTTLDAQNCYTFSNGVESYKIYDSPAGKPFNLGERTMAVSNQDFKEADRFASVTYSGVFRENANINNLNEFNLGLVNYRDYETIFGPIQLMHARRTDVLTLQEDRITYIMVDKDIISDAVGGGAIVSTPQVLGKQIARIEEYGISFNPESFVAWGSDMFFTDTKRGAVINLRGGSLKSDQLQVVSTFGMNSWFRDSFNTQLTTQKLGAYDPYMDEYVLGTNLIKVPVPLNLVPCGQQGQHDRSSQIISYDVDLGNVIGQVDVVYGVTLGSVDITVTWNGNVSSVTANTAGTLSFQKTLNTPTSCSILITPSEPSSYTINVNCPEEKEVRVIQVVRNSPNYVTQSIHTNYSWTNGNTTSPSTGFSSANLVLLQPSAYEENIGVRSVGVFPYSGTDITLRTEKYGSDTFDFNPTYHTFRILSSNTLYNNNTAEVNSLIAASSIIAPVSNPSTGVNQATATNFSMPDANLYLYLIWDFTQITKQEVCFCTAPSNIEEVCCTCTGICKNIFIGPNTESIDQACTTDVDSPQVGSNNVSFLGNGSIPTIGDIVYNTDNCSLPVRTGGFYIVSAVSPSILPKTYIEINNSGVVISSGTC